MCWLMDKVFILSARCYNCSHLHLITQKLGYPSETYSILRYKNPILLAPSRPIPIKLRKGVANEDLQTRCGFHCTLSRCQTTRSVGL